MAQNTRVICFSFLESFADAAHLLALSKCYSEMFFTQSFTGCASQF